MARNSAIIALIGCTALQGCGVLQSEPAGNLSDTLSSPGMDAQAGRIYMMPKALLPVELVINGGAVRLDVLAPTVVGDTDYRYLLRQPNHPFRSDNVDVEIDPQTSLLKSIKVTTTDKTGDIIKKIAATRAKPEGGESGDVKLHKALIDPADPDQINAVNLAMNETLSFHLGRLRAECAQNRAEHEQAKTTPGSADVERCKALAQLESTRAAMTPRDRKPYAGSIMYVGVTVGEPKGLVKRQQNAGPSAQPSCMNGICHRATMPFVVNAHVLGTTSSTVVYLPNASPVLSLPIASHALVTTTYDLVFANGSLSKVTKDAPSSALALVSLPLDVVKAVADTVSDLIQLKIDTSGKEKALADAKVAQITAQAALEAKLAEQASSTGQESAVYAGASSKGVLLSAFVGKPSSALPLDAPTAPVGTPATPLPRVGQPGQGSDGSLGTGAVPPPQGK
jgi:hypothetical protein